jgi:hypothetical protein
MVTKAEWNRVVTPLQPSGCRGFFYLMGLTNPLSICWEEGEQHVEKDTIRYIRRLRQ